MPVSVKSASASAVPLDYSIGWVTCTVCRHDGRSDGWLGVPWTEHPGRTSPGSLRAAGRAHTGMHARLGAARQARTRRQRGPSVAVRETADGAHRPSVPRRPRPRVLAGELST